MSQSQCKHQIEIGLAEHLTYLCTLTEGHEGPHHITISSDFNLARAEDDKTGLFGNCGDCPAVGRAT